MSCCVVSEATLNFAYVFGATRTARAVCISFGLALSPVESCSLQSSRSSGHTFTPELKEMQAQKLENRAGSAGKSIGRA